MGSGDQLLIGEIATTTDYVANGSFASLKENVSYSYTKSYAILIRLVDFKSGWKKPFVYVDEHGFKFLKKSCLEVGDLIISNVGAYAGTVFRTPDLGYPMTLGPNSIVLKNLQCSDFWYYYFSSRIGQHQIDSIKSGSAQPKFNKTDFRRLSVPDVPLGKQRNIASVLGTLDDKIENNCRMNETLEEMAQAIFKSWFVDFDPVHAKAAGNSPAHMDADTAALFPSSFGDYGLPVGWSEGLVSDIAHLNKATLKPSEFAADFIEHYSLPAFDIGKYPAIDFGGDVKSNKTIVPPNSVLLSKLNPNIERVWLPIFQTEHRALSSTEFLVLTKKGIGRRNFLYSLFRSRAFLVRYEGLVTGTSKSHQRVRPQMLLDMNLNLPTTELVAAFDNRVGSLFEKVITNQNENQTLANLRDTLLPKLMNGEIRVKDTEQEVEAIA
jgi:type I restriction enzyme, S subunit